ncbi:12195_t:CDS:2 [Funneliformis geosporum]|nr:12195_t:CDS:2 [Funneliformis geosporum]
MVHYNNYTRNFRFNHPPDKDVLVGKSADENEKRSGGAGEPPIISKLPKEDSLTKEILLLYQSLLPTKDSDYKRKDFADKIEKLLNEEWPGHDIKVHMFGSSMNLLGTTQSDVDLCVTTQWNGLRGIINLSKCLKNRGMEILQCVPKAKVPIVRLWDPSLHLACDININNTLALHNTRLIRNYVTIDTRVRPLAMIVKHWARKRVLNDAAKGGTISTYTWTCIVLNFLQMRNPPILPVLHSMPHDDVEPIIVNGEDASFYENVENLKEFGSKNKESVGGLLFGFFRRMAYEFDYEKHVISLRHGKYLTKTEKGWDTCKGWKMLCVEEPFNTTRNLGNSADDISDMNGKSAYPQEAQYNEEDESNTPNTSRFVQADDIPSSRKDVLCPTINGEDFIPTSETMHVDTKRMNGYNENIDVDRFSAYQTKKFVSENDIYPNRRERTALPEKIGDESSFASLTTTTHDISQFRHDVTSSESKNDEQFSFRGPSARQFNYNRQGPMKKKNDKRLSQTRPINDDHNFSRISVHDSVPSNSAHKSNQNIETEESTKRFYYANPTFYKHHNQKSDFISNQKNSRTQCSSRSNFSQNSDPSYNSDVKYNNNNGYSNYSRRSNTPNDSDQKNFSAHNSNFSYDSDRRNFYNKNHKQKQIEELTSSSPVISFEDSSSNSNFDNNIRLNPVQVSSPKTVYKSQGSNNYKNVRKNLQNNLKSSQKSAENFEFNNNYPLNNYSTSTSRNNSSNNNGLKVSTRFNDSVYSDASNGNGFLSPQNSISQQQPFQNQLEQSNDGPDYQRRMSHQSSSDGSNSQSSGNTSNTSYSNSSNYSKNYQQKSNNNQDNYHQQQNLNKPVYNNSKKKQKNNQQAENRNTNNDNNGVYRNSMNGNCYSNSGNRSNGRDSVFINYEITSMSDPNSHINQGYQVMSNVGNDNNYYTCDNSVTGYRDNGYSDILKGCNSNVGKDSNFSKTSNVNYINGSKLVNGGSQSSIRNVNGGNLNNNCSRSSINEFHNSYGSCQHIPKSVETNNNFNAQAKHGNNNYSMSPKNGGNINNGFTNGQRMNQNKKDDGSNQLQQSLQIQSLPQERQIYNNCQLLQHHNQQESSPRQKNVQNVNVKKGNKAGSKKQHGHKQSFECQPQQ